MSKTQNIIDELEDKVKAYSIIEEMLAERYEFNCGKVGRSSINPNLFFAMFFREPPNWGETNDHLYLESINLYENAGHGNTFLEAIEEAREITLRKGL